MTWLTLAAWIVLVLFFGLLSLICLSLWKRKPDAADGEYWPEISILVAARNEEANIGRLISSLKALNYPRHKLQILIGDDQSTDRTAALINEQTEGLDHFRLVTVTRQLGKARGKANVLANLAHEATGDIWFITDADIAVNPDWIRGLLNQFDARTGIVSGTTVVQSFRKLGFMQGIDWLFFMGLLQSFYRLGVGCTAIGNNMAIRREAYWSTGGYEEIDFSITEDFKLYKEVLAQGWEAKNTDDIGGVVYSAPARNLHTLLNQRKRWLRGAEGLPWYWLGIFGVYAAFLPALIILFIFQPFSAILIWLAKWNIQTVLVMLFNLRLGRPLQIKSWQALLYEPYTHLVNYGSLLFYLLPLKFDWKGRKY